MKPGRHYFTIRIYWEDTDAGGVVFFANYLKFFERARTEWLRDLGVSQEQWRLAGRAFVVSDTRVRYRLPARLDDELSIQTAVTQFGKASLQLNQQVWRDSTLLAEGEIRIGFVDILSFRPCRIPPDILSLIS